MICVFSFKSFVCKSVDCIQVVWKLVTSLLNNVFKFSIFGDKVSLLVGLKFLYSFFSVDKMRFNIIEPELVLVLVFVVFDDYCYFNILPWVVW